MGVSSEKQPGCALGSEELLRPGGVSAGKDPTAGLGPQFCVTAGEDEAYEGHPTVHSRPGREASMEVP